MKEKVMTIIMTVTFLLAINLPDDSGLIGLILCIIPFTWLSLLFKNELDGEENE